VAGKNHIWFKSTTQVDYYGSNIMIFAK